MPIDMMKVEFLWGVERWRIVAAVIAILLGFLARRGIVALFRGFLKRQADKTSVEWDDELVEFVPAPLAAIAQVGIWYGAALLMKLPTEPVDARKIVASGLMVALWIASAWLIFRIVDVLCGALGRLSERTESKLDDQLIPLVRKTLKILAAVIIFVMAVQNLGYSVTSLVASLGIGGLALALAAKDTVANLFGSIVVFTDQPFQIGDWIECGDVQGTVEEVGFRTTRVRRFDQSLVTVPNATFSDTPIVNHSRRPVRRVAMTIGVTYETSAAKMRALLDALRSLVEDHPEIDDEFHFVHFTEFGGSSLDVQIYCFTKSTDWIEHLTAREDLMLKVMEAVEEVGLEMAFPTRTVYFRDEQWPKRTA